MKQGPSKDATSKFCFSPDVWSQGAVGANKIRARPAEQKKIEVPICAPFSIQHHYHDWLYQQFRPVTLQQRLPDQEDDLKPEFKLKVAEWEVRKALAGHSNKVQLIIIMDW